METSWSKNISEGSNWVTAALVRALCRTRSITVPRSLMIYYVNRVDRVDRQ